MKTNNIYNSKNAVVGRIVEEENGNHRLLDKSNKYMGFYNKTSNATFNATGRRIGPGNILITLLGEIN
jgi:hypothetical protein